MRLRAKMIILGIAPLAASLFIGSSYIVSLWNDYRSARATLDDLAYLKQTSAWVGALQKERGLAGLAISGGVDPQEYKDSFGPMNAAAQAWTKEAAKAGLPKSLEDLVAMHLGLVKNNRDGVLEGYVAFGDSFDIYSKLVKALVDSMKHATENSAPGTAAKLMTLILLEEAKEYAGRSRALLSFTLSNDAPVEGDTLLEVIRRYGAIGALLTSGELDLDPAGSQGIDSFLVSEQYDLLGAVVREVAERGSRGGYGRDGAEFFSQMTDLMGILQSVIDVESAGVTTMLGKRMAQKEAGFFGYSGLLLAILVVAGVLVVFSIGTITRSVRKVSSAFKDIAEGEGDLRQRIAIQSKDELGELASDFNTFSAEIGSVVGLVKEEAGKLFVDMENLSANMEETAGAVQEIAATIDSIRQRSVEQSNRVSGSANRVEEIGRGIESLADAASRQEEELSTSASSIEELVASVKSVNLNVDRVSDRYGELESKSQAGREAIRTVSEQARDIGSQSEGLREANELISSIASKTNLLAMNAAIEAAHAGEFGKGFAVVADEIRSLAEGAAEQSKAVSASIATIGASIEGIVESSRQAESTFDLIADQIVELSRLQVEVKAAMDEQASGSNQALTALAKMKEAAARVLAESSEMRGDAKSVLAEMARLLDLTKELDDGMKEMAIGAAEIRQAAASTSELSARATESVKALGAQTDKFKV